MINAISNWTKSLGLALVIVSILEMLLPNNKLKKYIKVVMGLYIIFTIISPFINQEESFALDDFDMENYISDNNTNEVDQTSMDNRIKQLYIEQMEKTVKSKLEEKGYNVLSCDIDAQIPDDISNAQINKIKLKIKKSESNNKNESSVENKVVSAIDSIKEIQIGNDSEEKSNSGLNKTEIKELKKFLIDEYGVSEECLEIN